MPLLSAFLSLFAEDPTIRMLQMLLLFAATVDVFFVFYATRDILLRTRSFLYQFLSIVLVALLPGFGFLIYLLVRPARTLRQRETDLLIREIAAVLHELGEEDEEELMALDDLGEEPEEEEEHSTEEPTAVAPDKP